MQYYHVVVACAGYTRNAVASKALTLISGAPDIRAQHSLLNRVVKVEKEKLEARSEFCYLGDMLSAGSCCKLAACPSPSNQPQSAPCGQR